MKNYEAKMVVNSVRKLGLLNGAKLGEEYFYSCLPICIIDSVFSISIRYAIVKKIVSNFCVFSNQNSLRRGNKIPPISLQYTVDDFINLTRKYTYDELAVKVFKSKHRTSPRNGILKSQAVVQFAETLQQFEVNFFQDLWKVQDVPDFERKIRSISGQRSGISLSYFWMLAGSDEFVKPDRWILAYLSSQIGRSIKPMEACSIIQATCGQLQEEFPKVTPRLLDHVIWRYQRTTSLKN